MGNGVDFEYFDPAGTLDNPDLSNRRFLAFIGSMSYYPNVEAADWFARNIFRALRLRFPDLELFIVGRDPAPPVRALAQMAGVHVTGTVSDVRPYIKACAAVIAPMRIARGIQNKVLEALAMGKPVLASSSVCKTLSPLPSAVKPCETEEDYIRETQAVFGLHDKEPNQIRQSALAQFTWEANLRVLSEELCRLS
jgi:glycosyltransferase involved in cell wall biosynthesis